MYQLEEFPDVFADACLRDAEGRMLLLSLYGRDTALNQFVAAISLPASQLGVGAFHLVGVDGRRHFCDVGGADRLAKHSGRLPRQNLFGPLSHLWIYDKALQAPDLVNRIGWVLLRGEGSQADLQLELLGWRLMQRLSPVALLDTWREALIEWARGAGVLRELNEPRFPPLGPVRGLRVSLGEAFLAQVSSLVRSGEIRLPAAAPARQDQAMTA